jgi:hypothetical protein
MTGEPRINCRHRQRGLSLSRKPEWPFDLPNFLSKVHRRFFAREEAAGSENGQSPQSGVEFKNASVCTSSHPYIFIALCLSKHEIMLQPTCIVITIQSSNNWTFNPNLTTYHSQQVLKIQSRFYTKIKRCSWWNLPVKKEKGINALRNHKVTYLCAIVNYFSLRPQVFLSTNTQHVSAWTCVTNLIVTVANFLYIKVYLLQVG